MGAFRHRRFPAISGRGAEDSKLAKFSPMANGYIHTECNCTARQIWTKDVWKRQILRTDALSHQMSSSLPPKSPQNSILRGPFNAKSIIQIALCKSHANGATKVKLYSYRYRQVLEVCQKFSARGCPRGAWPLNIHLGPPYYIGNYYS